ncbi:hypothetical protein KFE25_006036 [Diacronema lutheri]|uniref:molybdopterin adenylyltransferase n=2 Tax=Diacronema lutheri TaxID=2081491 RepID=A0A8J6CFY2_DIALT|nr:hypothetical protein KFE25_006036 [Diacronema lutheri]
MADLATAITMSDAIRIALEHAVALDPVEMLVDDSLNHVLAADVIAPDPHPPFRASIKDGYALRACDALRADARIEVVGDSRAGTRAVPIVGPGQACYVTTGGPVPDGADAVVEVERTAEAGRRAIHVLRAPKVGQDIRPVGFDIPAGATVLAAGELIGAPEIGILATVGATSVRAHPKPRLAVVSTGDEVTDARALGADGGAPRLAPNCIRDAVRPMLLAAARDERLVCHALDLGICMDAAPPLRAAIEAALDAGADALITSGAVSAGDRDLLGSHVLAEYGEVLYALVRMKPGKPLTLTVVHRAAKKRPMLIFSLPGNPVSAYATFQLVVAPALRKMGGSAEPRGRALPVQLGASIPLDAERPEYHRATLDANAGVLMAHSTGGQISSRLLSCRQADVLLELPQGPGVLAAGTHVSAIVVRDLRAHVAQRAPAEPRGRVRVRVLLLPAHGSDGEHARPGPDDVAARLLLERCAAAATGGLRAAGLAADVSTGGADEGAHAHFADGAQVLVLALRDPAVRLGDSTVDEARVALGDRLTAVPALAASMRRIGASRTSAAPSAHDAAIVDRRSMLLVLDAAAETVAACVRAAAIALAALAVTSGAVTPGTVMQ